ncbi:MAG: hypothetical protein RBG1_1C00001G1720 [candidate division Zixibacteria bacterium RBG-1]|nr:MAG: hypothetical protein RBG1_1C00001G1720 [candidate division Zixibacteria bacterium RBG-1]OGC84665.1 MAG: hypothetical protein A2V73_02890 [candidate division Zixibacteria bacterium RBG_19FT_COMBO_42_43]
MNIADRVDFNYVIGLLNKRIESLESELGKAKEQLDLLLSGQGSSTRRSRRKPRGRKPDPRFQELEKLILEVLDSKQMRTGKIFNQINAIKPETFTYDDVRRTLGRMAELEHPKKGTWRKKEISAT